MAKGKFASPFRRMSLTPADMSELEVVAEGIVDANLAHYLLFWDVDNRKVNPNAWKLTKSKDQMRSILCVGLIPGSLDDVMLGVMSPTLEITRTKASYVDDLSGAAVLSTVKEPTAADPFKSSAVKWMELDVRRRSMGFVKNRDYVYVEATGVKNLPSGESVGFHVMHSVDIPQAHDLSGRVRAKLSVCSFFQPRLDKSVAVYVMAIMDPMSDKIRRVVAPCFIKMLLSTVKYAHCGEMRKLSQALSERNAESKHAEPPSGDHNCITCMKPMRVWRFGKIMGHRSACKMCFGFVCGSCKIEKKLSCMSPNMKMTQRKVTFCSSCVSEALTATPSEMRNASNCWRWGTVLDNEASAISYDFANTR
ncbi:hypothetical protein PHYSODRAFT_508226 [Phytophthora sojae]|uniref:FYVE-type domain-containing protein n=1 Tax=Phytophthora sojae (strain P6497) TaxID=1094619 RepID=G4ZQ20_PHYSP|nr:hypothetical protein PHYSODRAFT_508226 [Phytophthora sojae]EGZ14409.1 hypothetical protein PHYSODRAFT_508226 [Phytophthora sojae]|eukprot:XP_009528158.1 hypothetical protein PHYSODRAFT_508226 [Phytophthora sojae]